MLLICRLVRGPIVQSPTVGWGNPIVQNRIVGWGNPIYGYISYLLFIFYVPLTYPEIIWNYPVESFGTILKSICIILKSLGTMVKSCGTILKSFELLRSSLG